MRTFLNKIQRAYLWVLIKLIDLVVPRLSVRARELIVSNLAIWMGTRIQRCLEEERSVMGWRERWLMRRMKEIAVLCAKHLPDDYDPYRNS